MCTNENNEVVPESEGGTFEEKQKKVSVKYPKEARGLFAVAEVETEAGYEGRRLPPLNYTEQWIVGIKEWDVEFEKERRRVLPMTVKFGGVGKGYEDAPGANMIGASGEPRWKEAIKAQLHNRAGSGKSKALRCVTDLIDHMIEESKKLYAGTDMQDKFMIFHDALSTWYEGEAQEYIKQQHPGYADRFIRPVGTTAAGTIYNTGTISRPPGNSPENARGLDAYGFFDLEHAMSFNCALAHVYLFGDERRIFGQGTPRELWFLMEQTWSVVGAPSNARIAEDIEGWERVCQKIVAAEGCIVPDENFRTGRRERKMHGDGNRKTRLRTRDRISTQNSDLPVHPKLLHAYEILMGTTDDPAAADLLSRGKASASSSGTAKKPQRRRAGTRCDCAVCQSLNVVANGDNP